MSVEAGGTPAGAATASGSTAGVSAGSAGAGPPNSGAGNAGGAPAASAASSAGAPADWRLGLPAEVAAAPWAKTHKTAESFWKSMSEAQALIGRSIQVPTDGNREAWERVWNKMGRPVDPAGYKLKDPEGVKMPSALSDGFREFAHNIGLSNWQAQQLIDHVGKKLAADITPGSTRDAAVTAKELKSAWGGAYEKNMMLADRAVQFAGGESLAKALKVTGAGNEPAVVIALARIGAFLAEDGVVSGEGPVGQATANTDLQAIYNNPKHAYWNRSDPGHKAAVEEVLRLSQMVHGRP